MASPTLADLLKKDAPPLPRDERTVTLIEGQHLLTASQRLEEERIDLLMQAERDAEKAEEDGRKRTQKAGQRPEPTLPPRVEEIAAEHLSIRDRLADFQGKVGLCGVEGGEWQRFKDKFPAREDSTDDLRVARGHCNASALFFQLGRFVASWNGEDLAEGAWDSRLAEMICYADRRDLVTAVVDMHEANLPRVSPKSLNGSSATEPSATD